MTANAAAKAGAAAKAPAAAKKAPAAAKAPTEGKKETKPRAPRVDYGYSPAATIVINADKEVKYRGARKAWYELLKAHNGKTVEAFEKAAKDNAEKEFKDPPRGWLRFFVQDEAISLKTSA